MTATPTATPTPGGAPPPGVGTVLLDACGDPATLVVDFLNTLHIWDSRDELGTLDQWQRWLGARDLGVAFGPLNEQGLTQARALRDDLRRRAQGDDCAEVRQIGIQVALTPEGQVALSAPTPEGLVAAAVATLAIERRLERVKICPADDCQEAFYDVSRNRSRQWCSMESCGNRAKARAHRTRVKASAH